MGQVVQLQVADRTHEVTVKEFNGQRVVTLKDVDEVHGRPEGTARKRFNDHKKHLINGEDYFVRKTDEAAKEYGIVAPNGLVLLTETGYLIPRKTAKSTQNAFADFSDIFDERNSIPATDSHSE